MGAPTQRRTRLLTTLGVVLALLAFGLELGSSFLVGALTPSRATVAALVAQQAGDLDADERAELVDEVVRRQAEADPPGLGLPYLALVDGMLLFALGTYLLHLHWPRVAKGCLQKLVYVLLPLLGGLVGLLFALLALVLLLVMVSLFLAAPFGTLAYIAAWGFFDTTTASMLLVTSTLLVAGTAVLFVLGDPRFLANRKLVALLLTSVGAKLLLGFLHAVVPGLLVSITDALGAVVLGVVALVWGLVLAINALF